MNQIGYFKYIHSNLLENIFSGHRIRFTQPLELNDPLEFNPILSGYSEMHYRGFLINGVEMPSCIGWDRYHLIRCKLDMYGVLCLTSNPESFYMWSHYANGHKGFLIELSPDFNEHQAFLSSQNKPYQVRAVKYCDRFEVDLTKIDDGAGFVRHEQFDELFYVKTKRWETEKEYRLIRRLKDLLPPTEKIYLGDLPMELISSVTFGALMDVSQKRRIVDLCGDAQVDFFQCAIAPDRCDDNGLYGKVERHPLNEDDLRRVLNLRRQDSVGFIVEDKALEGAIASLIDIPDLTHLPYYSGAEEKVKEMFLRRRKRLEMR